MSTFNINPLPKDSPFAALPELEASLAEFQAATSEPSVSSKTQKAVAPVFAAIGGRDRSESSSVTDTTPPATRLLVTESSDSDTSKVSSLTTPSPSLSPTKPPLPPGKKGKKTVTVTALTDAELISLVVERFPLPVTKVVVPGKGIFDKDIIKYEFTSQLATIVSDITKILKNYLSKNSSCLNARADKDIKRKKSVLLGILDVVYAKIKEKIPDFNEPPAATVHDKVNKNLASDNLAPSDVRRCHNRASTLANVNLSALAAEASKPLPDSEKIKP